MIGEVAMARSALIGGAVLAIPTSVIAGFVFQANVGISIALAAVVVLGNVAISAFFAALGGRIGGLAGLAMSIPSFAVRLIAALLGLTALQGRSFIHDQTFVAAFATLLAVSLFLQSKTWRNTPWLANTFTQRTEEETA